MKRIVRTDNGYIASLSSLTAVFILCFCLMSCGGSDSADSGFPPDRQNEPLSEMSDPEEPTFFPHGPISSDEERTPDPFGFIMDWLNPDLIAANGAGIRHVAPISWNLLMPDGVNFDSQELARLDAVVRNTRDNGLQVFLRLRSGGYSGSDGFAAIPKEDWPIDTTDYSQPPYNGDKNGEWLPQAREGTDKAYPPKVLTRDTPGNTSPWYNYVYALASRYNGTTSDPERPGEYLPQIDYWALDGEEEMPGRWYGTATDLYGGAGGDPDVGTLPSFYRAVHAANPDAEVVGGSLTDATVLVYIVREMMQERGGYDAELLQFANDWLRQATHMRFPSVAVMRSMMESPRFAHHLSFVDSLLAANKHYDILGYHMYSTYKHLPDLINFYRQKMAQYGFSKPLWGTETGIINFPMESHEIQAQRVIKLLTVSLAQGVQHFTYSGMVESLLQFPNFYGLYNQSLAPYRALYPKSPPDQVNSLFGYVARESFAFFARTIKEKEYQFDRTIRRGDAELYVFRSGTAGSMFCVAWSDEEQESFDPRPELGIPLSANLDLFDYRGRPQNASGNLTFSPFPVFLEWDE